MFSFQLVICINIILDQLLWLIPIFHNNSTAADTKSPDSEFSWSFVSTDWLTEMHTFITDLISV